MGPETDFLNLNHQTEVDSDVKPYTMKEAITEAKRCLQCKVPMCKRGCPINNNITEFIGSLAMGNLGEARAYLTQKTNLPAVCGRVCPHEKQCQGSCVLARKGQALHIGKLEQFVADFDADMELIRYTIPGKNRGKVAVIGSGPAGLTVAGDLALMGFKVTVYEAEEEPGGILMYGIPEFRLPKDVVRKEIKRIEEHGVTFITNTKIGVDKTIDNLFDEGYDAIFIGTGTAVSKGLDIPGRTLKGVMKSNYMLRRVFMFRSGEIKKEDLPVLPGERVLVIGAGNVAMDASRTAMRCGAESCTVVYRDVLETISAEPNEYEGAVNDGVQFKWKSTPIEYIGDASGRYLRGLKVECEGNEEIIPCDKCIIAIGSKPARLIISTTEGIEVNDQGYVEIREEPYGMTTLKGVFAGGDVVHRPATVVLAMKEAKEVAEGIAKYVDAVKLINSLK
ncbi:MAG: NAD(P)-dependent oxidoreductase [Clostridiales bacterium]|nr:NAD(P)-dependent oxidoreductase [Clostridiales bacterium]